MNNNSKMVLVAMLGVIAMIVAGIVIFNDDENQTTPLTAEQQVLLEELKQMRQGDIVLDLTGTVIDQNTTVLLVTSLAAVRYDCFLKGINMRRSRAFSFEELARHNCRVIPSTSEEWHTTLRAELTKPF